MISNTNKLVSWKKDSCNNYTLDNLSEDLANITITGETNNFEKTLAIEAGSGTTVELPSDGIYKVCFDGREPDSYTELDSDIQEPDKRSFSVFTLAASTPFNFTKVIFNEVVVYDSAIDGAATETSPANLFTALTTNLPPGTNYELVAPNILPTLANSSFLGTSTSYRLIFVNKATTGNVPLEGDLVVLLVNGLPCFISPEVYCQVQYDTPVGFQYICDFSVKDDNDIITNLLEAPTDPFQVRYDLNKDPSEEALFQQHLSDYLTGLGYTVLETGNITTYHSEDCHKPCINFISMKFCNYTVSEGCEVTWCDYLYELCALHACVTKQVKEIFCFDCDPCKPCDTQEDAKKKEARERMNNLVALFFFSLMPLIGKDRMDYLGDFKPDESRVENVMKIKDIFEKLVDFVDICGECVDTECEGCDCGCNNC